ncbi:MAG: FtsX-like permease family protein [Acidobacteria bacterium]|nr:FtsX-like permease family protein [Acidobacteriota bacterium]
MTSHRLPVLVALVAAALAPRPLRQALLGDLAEEFAAIAGTAGRGPARRWAWQQLRSPDWLRLRTYNRTPRRWFGARSRPSLPPTHGSPLEPDPMQNLLFDLQGAFRTIRRQPRLAATVILTVAIGIVGSAATLGVIDAVLLEPLPYEASRGLVTLRSQSDNGQIVDGPVSLVNLREWGELPVFDGVFAVQGAAMTYRGGDHPENLSAARVSPGTLDILGVDPQQGRGFSDEEGVPGNHRVVLISHGIWQTRFAGEPALGRAMILNDVEHTVIGVLPPEFRMPGELASGYTRDLLVPLAPDPENWPRNRRAAFAFARLADGTSIGRAQETLDSTFASQAELHPGANDGWQITTRRITDVVLGPFRTVLLITFGAALMLLTLATVNLINLMLVQGLNRQAELAIRASLGAARPRLIRGLLTEGVVLGVLGGIVGLFGSGFLLTALTQLTPGNVPRLENSAVSVSVVAATLLVSALVGLFFGGIPAWLATRPGQLSSASAGDRGATSSPWQRRAIDAAATLQIGLAVTLLVGAGLLGRSFVGLLGIDPGFASDNVLTVQVVALRPTYENMEARTAFVEQVQRSFRAVPGVTAVGVTNFMPYTGANTVDGYDLRDMPFERRPGAGYRAIDAHYLDILEIEVVKGRAITPADIESQAPVAMINESMAASVFNGVDPIGQGISRDAEAEGHVWLEIVGVVADIKHTGPEAAAEPEWYASFNRDPYALKSFVLATSLAPVRAALSEVDPMMAPFAVQSMNDFIDEHVAGPRFNVATIGAFALVAIALAAVGMFGVIANSVARRHRETGIRLALGALGPQVRNQLVTEGMRLAALGTVLGLGASFLLTQVLTSMLRGVSPRDPATMTAVAGLTLLVAATACFVPARRAARVDPATALRAD